MTRKVLDRFTWPGRQRWIDQYVWGCATCQQNKNLMHHTRVPLYKITVPHNTSPFSQVAMDLITGLPKSRGHNSILTIVDHRCSRAAIFLPCKKAIMGPQIMQLYYKHLYPWFGLPKRLISDQDPRFITLQLSTSKRTRHLMEPLNGIPPSDQRTNRAKEPM